MDLNAIAGASMLTNSAQTQQNLSLAMVKMNADSQEKVSNMLAQNALQAPQPVKGEGYNFSTYA